MSCRANVEAGKPGLSRPVPERAGKGSRMWQRAGKIGAGYKLTREPNAVTVGTRLKLKPGQVGAIENKGKSAKIAMAKVRRIQGIDRFVIQAFHHSAGEV